MASHAGERRMRALCPEPGHRQWVAPPSADLSCTLCDEPFSREAGREPVTLPCGHTFCRGCALGWFTAASKLCPTCRSTASKGVKPAKLGANVLVLNLVDQLRIFCRFGLRETREGEWEADPEGCQVQLVPGNAAAHEATCGFALVRCSFAGCGAELRRSEIDAHDAAEALRHARGEREARLAGEKALAAADARHTARFETLEASSAARISALEKAQASDKAVSLSRFAALEAALASSRPLGGGASAGPAALQLVRAQGCDWTLRRTLEGHTGDVWCCTFHPDEMLLASSSEDKSVKLWNTASGQCVRTLVEHSACVTACTFSPDGATILSSSADRTLQLWRTSDGACLLTLTGHASFVTRCAFSPDGQQILSGTADGTLMLWNASTGACIRTFDGHTDCIWGCAFSSDGSTSLSCSHDSTLKLWRTSTGECLRTLGGHTDYVFGCAFSPDGALIVSASFDNTLKLWNAATGDCIRTLGGHTDAVESCAFSPDGATILSGSDDDTLKLWRAETGECLQTLVGHTSCVMSCAFSPDGRTIVSSSYDKTVKLWERATMDHYRFLPDPSTRPKIDLLRAAWFSVVRSARSSGLETQFSRAVVLRQSWAPTTTREIISFRDETAESNAVSRVPAPIHSVAEVVSTHPAEREADSRLLARKLAPSLRPPEVRSSPPLSLAFHNHQVPCDASYLVIGEASLATCASEARLSSGTLSAGRARCRRRHT